MQNVRPAAVAGLFYPDSESELRRQVETFLREEDSPAVAGGPKAVIAPHAGYVYSGPIAASAFGTWSAESDTIQRVVLLGPAHRVPVRGLALPAVEAFDTPLGRVRVDGELVRTVSALPQVSSNPLAHAPEHCLEVELPFLQLLLGSFTILPLLISDATPAEIAEVLEAVWGDRETRFVISSDLSHYLSYDAARDLDRETSQAVLALRDDLETFRACGAAAINGLLFAARNRSLSARLLDLRNSGDTAGDRMRVVGYGAFSFAEPA